MDFLEMIGERLGSKVVGKLLSTLSGLEPGKRYPHAQYGPIVIPKTPELKPGEPTLRRVPIQITFPGFLALSVGILWYAKRAMDPAPLGALPQEPLKQQELFPKLKRELHLEAKDVAESDDPVEVCLQRRFGWKLKRMRELRESIAEKSQPAIFKELEEELTAPEQELADNIDECLERVAAQYGSLEAAGIILEDCPLCGDDD